jgi:hypothetical protein
VLTGDLNCACIDWINSSCNDPIQKLLLDAVSDLGFLQFVDKPTRENNILDLVLCNDPLLIVDVDVTTLFSTSDHFTIEFLLNVSLAKCNVDEKCYGIQDQTFYSWGKVNWNMMKSFMLRVDWGCILNECVDADQCYSNFCLVLQSAIDKFVPIKSIRNKVKSKDKIFYPKLIRKLLARKARVWRRYKAKRTTQRKEAYNKIARRCKYLIDKKATDRERAILKSADLGKFFRFVNSKLSSKSGIGPLKNLIGGYSFTAFEKSELMNNYFSSVCTKDNGKLPIFDSRIQTGTSFENVIFYESEIFRILSKKNFKTVCQLVRIDFRQSSSKTSWGSCITYCYDLQFLF